MEEMKDVARAQPLVLTDLLFSQVPAPRWEYIKGVQNLFVSLRQFGGVVHRPRTHVFHVLQGYCLFSGHVTCQR